VGYEPIDYQKSIKKFLSSSLTMVWTVVGGNNQSDRKEDTENGIKHLSQKEMNQPLDCDSSREKNENERKEISNTGSDNDGDDSNHSKDWNVRSSLTALNQAKNFGNTVIKDAKKSFMGYWNEVKQTVESHLLQNNVPT